MAIQLGLVGVAVLWAMWIAHLLVFRGNGLVEWIGLVVVVVQNIVGSIFNSHLFDFVQGWTFVIGVGVAGATVLQANNENRHQARVDVLMAGSGLGETNHKLEPWNRALLPSRNDRIIFKSGE